MRIAFFDFDGTITKKDTLIDFIRYAKGDKKFILGMIYLSPMLLLYSLKIISNYKAKQKLFSYFFNGYTQETFKKLATEYSLRFVDRLVRQKAMDKIIYHKSQGDKVVVVSASIDCWIRPWCEKNNIELIATKIEIIEDTISGNFLTKNCYGIEKVNRIKDNYNLDEYDYIFGYGDSSGDKEMLSIVNEKNYKIFE
jgi:HAD superfamily hydrolase (TIGR01490 family)